jgi:hypothetical protein
MKMAQEAGVEKLWLQSQTRSKEQLVTTDGVLTLGDLLSNFKFKIPAHCRGDQP